MFGKTGYRDGGTRGGQDRFQWDDVKQDKYRENYLGHSVKAPVGRWQKNKDLFWYDKSTGRQLTAEEARKKELEEIRQRDQELINEALGLAPKRHLVVESNLDANEMKQLLAKGTAERDSLDVERIEGLGAAPARRHEHIERKSVVEREIERLKKAQEEGKAFSYDDAGAKEHADEDNHGSDDEQDDVRGAGDGGDAKKRKKEAQKEKKRMKKEAKKEKKRRRKEEKGEGGDKKRSRKEEEGKAGKDSSSSASPDRDDQRRRRRLSESPESRKQEGGHKVDGRPLSRRSESRERRRRSRSAERGGGDRRRERSRDRSPPRRRRHDSDDDEGRKR